MLSHIPDHAAFIGKVAGLLKPGGTLALATQNRPTLERHCIVAPPKPGQLRRWVDRAELAALAAPHFHVEELFSVTPIAQKGPRRLLTSGRINRLLHPMFGDRLRAMLEARDLGWTLMLRATRKA